MSPEQQRIALEALNANLRKVEHALPTIENNLIAKERDQSAKFTRAANRVEAAGNRMGSAINRVTGTSNNEVSKHMNYLTALSYVRNPIVLPTIPRGIRR